MGLATAYKLRWKRRGLLWRSLRSRHHLTESVNRTQQIRSKDILVVMTLRNEITRLPYFYEYYRRLGVSHFLVVDNASDDGTAEFLAAQPDTSVWQTQHSYRASRFGLDWMTWLQTRYCHNHWTLMVDADELLVFAHHETRSLQDLTQWLEAQGREVFGALMLDIYPEEALGQQAYEAGEDPTKVLNWFDAGPYRSQRQAPLENLWVQGGVRERVFFQDRPERSPTLNKMPLIKWSRRYAYVNSCHSALPRILNLGYDGPGVQAPSGVLLHTKFLPEIVVKSETEKQRAEHFNTPSDFDRYYDQITEQPTLWAPDSERLADWRQLERLGLMDSGGW